MRKYDKKNIAFYVCYKWEKVNNWICDFYNFPFLFSNM